MQPLPAVPRSEVLKLVQLVFVVMMSAMQDDPANKMFFETNVGRISLLSLSLSLSPLSLPLSPLSLFLSPSSLPLSPLPLSLIDTYAPSCYYMYSGVPDSVPEFHGSSPAAGLFHSRDQVLSSLPH